MCVFFVCFLWGGGVLLFFVLLFLFFCLFVVSRILVRLCIFISELLMLLLCAHLFFKYESVEHLLFLVALTLNVSNVLFCLND